MEYVPDDNTRILKVQGGEDDVVDFVPFSQIDSLNQQPGMKAQDFPIQQTTFVILNVTKPPLDDLNVRQALNYATDKDAIIKNVFFGQAQPMNAPIPLGTYVDKNSPGYPFNLDKAKQLMAAVVGAEWLHAADDRAQQQPGPHQYGHHPEGRVVEDRRQGRYPAAGRRVGPRRLPRRGQLHVDAERLDERHERPDRDRQLRDARRRRLRIVCLLDALQQSGPERQDHRRRTWSRIRRSARPTTSPFSERT